MLCSGAKRSSYFMNQPKRLQNLYCRRLFSRPSKSQFLILWQESSSGSSLKWLFSWSSKSLFIWFYQKKNAGQMIWLNKSLTLKNNLRIPCFIRYSIQFIPFASPAGGLRTCNTATFASFKKYPLRRIFWIPTSSVPNQKMRLMQVLV